MKQKKFFTVVLSTAIAAVLFAYPQLSAQAAIVPCTDNCQLCDLIRLMANIMQFIIGIVGSLTLLMFVYGGVYWLISAGRSGYVQKGKDIVINAVIGLVIVFLSYSIITFVLFATTGAQNEGNLRLFGQSWADFIQCQE